MLETATITDWFHRILDNAPDAIMALKAVRDANGRITDLQCLFTNKKAAQPGEHSAFVKSFSKEFPATRINGFFDQYVQVIETGVPWTDEVYFHADGFEFWTRITAKKVADGCLVSYLDITDKKRAEAEQQKIKANYNLLAEQTSDIVTRWDRRLKLVYANSALEKILGIPGHSLTGKDLNESGVPAEITRPWMESLQKVFETGEPAEHYNAFPATGKLHFLTRIVPEKNDAGEIETVLAVTHDITYLKKTQDEFARLKEQLTVSRTRELEETIAERKNAEEEITKLNRALVAMNNELRFLNSELKTFTTIAANDYSETLRHLYINLELIVNNDAHNLSNSGRANLRRAQSAIQRLKLLTDDLKAYTKLQEMDNRKQDVDLNAILNSVLGDFQPQTLQFNIHVECLTMPHINGYPFLISLVFHHLLDNAIKFRKDNERHSISITCRESIKGSDLVHEQAQNSLTYHIVSITDSGQGFAPEEAEKIFGIFYRLHEKGKYKGSGIGLAICKKIMDMHGGFIIAESDAGKGSSFHCFFPA